MALFTSNMNSPACIAYKSITLLFHKKSYSLVAFLGLSSMSLCAGHQVDPQLLFVFLLWNIIFQSEFNITQWFLKVLCIMRFLCFRRLTSYFIKLISLLIRSFSDLYPSITWVNSLIYVSSYSLLLSKLDLIFSSCLKT